MKDNFSSQSDKYAKYRPAYPSRLYQYLNSLVPNKNMVWDCGTGNGQVAFELAKTFNKVFATDISQSQIDHAPQADNIGYSIQPAEKTNFPDHQFDLIVIAQAIHWFDFEKFYAEVRRTAKENALIAVMGYGRIEISAELDEILSRFYHNTIGTYWDEERKYIDEHYKTIPFPFEEIQVPKFVNKLRWTKGHLIGYLKTWSAVKHYIKQNGSNPVDSIMSTIEQHWGDREEREVRFPLLFRVGKVRDFA
ncbi:class I SAM-dependent methyltransferase [Galbibacter sp. EGI 63066]|uniref:class I SAM-dependent methyltransferase n=1 Tax=Galbibacter sp. EGI 63066 TaxID=2993559 RepID=UPI0022499D8B|nr:class I SAM-dependent methyltransferase [Galbibacter sp. EGI 63066]MCX2680298.1 class I SAM-dependent methyltransferase [Galbibacter sp. EGI 63066]